MRITLYVMQHHKLYRVENNLHVSIFIQSLELGDIGSTESLRSFHLGMYTRC
jgi:hypothetical protein